MWKTVWQLLKSGTYSYQGLSNSIARYTLKGAENPKTCTWIFRAALFILAPKWKQAKRPSTDERINKMWYVRATEYYLAKKKRNEVRTCYNVEELGKHWAKRKSQVYQGHTLCDSIHMKCAAWANLERQKGDVWLPGAVGRRGNWEWLLAGPGFHSEVMETLSNCVMVIAAQSCEHTKKVTSLYTLKRLSLCYVKFYIMWKFYIIWTISQFLKNPTGLVLSHFLYSYRTWPKFKGIVLKLKDTINSKSSSSPGVVYHVTFCSPVNPLGHTQSSQNQRGKIRSLWIIFSSVLYLF